MDVSQETLKDLVSLKDDDGTSGHGATSADEGEQETHSLKESGEETSEKPSIPPEETVQEDTEIAVPVVPLPSLQMASPPDTDNISSQSEQSLPMGSEHSTKKETSEKLSIPPEETVQEDTEIAVPVVPLPSLQMASPPDTDSISSQSEKSLPMGSEHSTKKETSEKLSIPPEEMVQEDTEIAVPVVPLLSLQMASPPDSDSISSQSEQSLSMGSEHSIKKDLEQTTGSVTNEAELHASNLTIEEATPSALEEDTPDSVHSLLNCRVCQLFVRTVDRLLDKSEELMDHYMPLTEEEISNLKQAVEALDASSADHKTACLQRIRMLCSRLHQQAYMLALGKLRIARRSTHSNLSQLHHTLDLIEHVQQAAKPESQESQERLNELCSQWTQRRGSLPQQPEEVLVASRCQVPLNPDNSTVGAGTSLARSGSPAETRVPFRKDLSRDEASMIYSTPGCREENGLPPIEVESKTLEMSRNLTLDLKGTYESLLANLKDVPVHLKHKLYQTYQHIVELNARFTVARSFADLSGNIMGKGLRIMAEAQEAMDEVMEFVFQNPTALMAENHAPSAAEMTEASSARREDILKIQAAYDPKGCENEK